jgi:hypothetical protein
MPKSAFVQIAIVLILLSAVAQLKLSNQVPGLAIWALLFTVTGSVPCHYRRLGQSRRMLELRSKGTSVRKLANAQFSQ